MGGVVGGEGLLRGIQICVERVLCSLKMFLS